MVDYYYTNAVLGERPEVKKPNKEFLEQLTPDGFTDMIDYFYNILVESDIAFYFPTDEEELTFIKKEMVLIL